MVYLEFQEEKTKEKTKIKSDRMPFEFFSVATKRSFYGL